MLHLIHLLRVYTRLLRYALHLNTSVTYYVALHLVLSVSYYIALLVDFSEVRDDWFGNKPTKTIKPEGSVNQNYKGEES